MYTIEKVVKTQYLYDIRTDWVLIYNKQGELVNFHANCDNEVDQDYLWVNEPLRRLAGFGMSNSIAVELYIDITEMHYNG
jgi:hypothetical protein